jgi:hypothetical protein
MTTEPGKIVTQDAPLYQVDGWLMDPDAIPPETNVPFEHEMKCFELPNWHEIVVTDS